MIHSPTGIHPCVSVTDSEVIPPTHTHTHKLMHWATVLPHLFYIYTTGQHIWFPYKIIVHL